MMRTGIPVLLTMATLALSACSAPQHLAVSHRHSPGSEARIVVLPVHVPGDVESPQEEGRTLARLYGTELLRSYEVMDYSRFQAELADRQVVVDSVLTATTLQAAAEIGIDAILEAQVYRWRPGKPSFWFLAKGGQVGFQAQLVDVRTGSIIWSANRVRETRPDDTLAVGLSIVFQDLAAEMPKTLTPY